jgi:hypothetical protein
VRQVDRIRPAVDQVVGRTGDVRHRVHDSEERVAERHTRDGCRVVHLLAGLDVLGIRRVRLRLGAALDVLEDELDRVQAQAVGVVVRVHRHERLGGVRQRVEAGVGDEEPGQHLGEHGVDDRDRRVSA